MILAKYNYKIYNGELLTIVNIFKQWKYYLKRSQYSIIILSDYTNLYAFQTIKELKGYQIKQAKQLSAFNFIIVYRVGLKNLINISNKYPDYKANKEEYILLPILRKKLLYRVAAGPKKE